MAGDKEALEALYDATDGSNWTTSTNWKTSAALSAWHGVDTDASGRVTGLSLSGNQLSGSIPAELGDLTSLQRLILTNNQPSSAKEGWTKAVKTALTRGHGTASTVFCICWIRFSLPAPVFEAIMLASAGPL